MKSLATILNLATTESQNISSDNQALMLQLCDDQHRYLIEDYFDNERQYTTTTVGGMTLATTTTLANGATSGTLTAAWAYPTGTQGVTFVNTNGDYREVLFTNGSTAITWTVALTGATTSTTITTQGFQRYAIPANISKITDSTVTVGQLKFVPAPVQTRTDWDKLNFLPYSSDIPNYYYIYNGNLELWPIPSTTGNTITFNYKARIPNFSTAFLFSDTSGTAYVAGQKVFDYQAGSLSSIVAGSTSIVGSSTSWNTTGKFPLNVDISAYNLYLNIAPPSGEGIWYPIYKFNSDTTLTLALPIQTVQSSSTAAHGYSIAQLPVLSEDFHDMIPSGALMIYFSTIVEKPNKYNQFEKEYNKRMKRLEEYAGTKQVNYDLGAEPELLNPNNYPYGN